MYTYKRFKTSKPVLTIVLIALALVVWASLGYAVKPDRTAEVTITGPMQTTQIEVGGEVVSVPQIFRLGKDNHRALVLSRGVWHEWGAVPIRYNFEKTVEHCHCRDGTDLPPQCDLRDHLIDTLPTDPFPMRWGVAIGVDMSSLGEFEPDKSSTTNYKGGHSIEIWTDPNETPTITQTRERLWIPEGPSKSGKVTVKWVSDTGPDSSPRVRVFEFTSEQLQVASSPSGTEKKDKPRKVMRCDYIDAVANPDRDYDPPITVTVTTPASQAAPPASNLRSGLTSTWGRIKADRQ